MERVRARRFTFSPLTWVHPWCWFGLCWLFVGWGWCFVCCLFCFDCTWVFCTAVVWGHRASFSSNHRRLDDRQSLERARYELKKRNDESWRWFCIEVAWAMEVLAWNYLLEENISELSERRFTPVGFILLTFY